MVGNFFKKFEKMSLTKGAAGRILCGTPSRGASKGAARGRAARIAASEEGCGTGRGDAGNEARLSRGSTPRGAERCQAATG